MEFVNIVARRYIKRLKIALPESARGARSVLNQDVDDKMTVIPENVEIVYFVSIKCVLKRARNKAK